MMCGDNALCKPQRFHNSLELSSSTSYFNPRSGALGSAHQTRKCCTISLRDVESRANTERFQGSVPLLPHLCPLSVLKGGYMGYIRKALEKGFSEMYGFGGGVWNHIFSKIGHYR